MSILELKAKKRTKSGKGAARSLRRNGEVPAVLYGGGEESLSLVFNEKDVQALLQSDQAYNTALKLKIEDGGDQPAIIREIQKSVMKAGAIHVDLMRIAMDTKMEMNAPLDLINTEDLKKKGGVIQQLLDEVRIYCLPTNIPERITVDVSPFEIGMSIHIRDIQALEGVEFHHEPDEVIATLIEPKKKTDEELGLTGQPAAEPEKAEEADAKD